MPRGRRWLIGLAVLAAGLFGFLFFTTAGATLLVRTALSLAFDSGSVRFWRAKGSLSEPLVFYDVEVKDIKGLPSGSVLKIQQMTVSDFLLQLENSRIQVSNARLKFPQSDYPVVLSGSYQDLAFNVNVYSKSLGVRDTLDLFTEASELRDVSGVVTDVDSFLTGSWRKPQLAGSLLISRFSYKEFSLLDCSVSYNIRIEDIKEHPKPTGAIVFGTGLITSPHASVKLEGGKMIFSSDPKTPLLDFSGISDIEGVKIWIHLKGTLKKPDLHLSSDPPLSQESLLLMLMTGKKWGVSGSNAVGVNKSLSDKVELRYDVERPPPGTEQQKQIQTHKLGAEVKITDKISIEAEGQVRQQQQQDVQSVSGQPEQQKDGKVVLKYKRKF